jgi:hypothetical protein
MPEPRIVVATQPRYLPSCAYLARMLLADVFVYLDTVQYTPRDWENRNRIKSSAGPQWLSVPVVRVSREQRVRDTAIDDAQDWRRGHLRALELSYRRAPYFEPVFALVRATLERPWTHLWQVNLALADALLGYLGRRASWVLASTLGVDDLRGQELLIEICRRVHGAVYLSGPLGRRYIEPERFRAAGLGLAYHDYRAPEYPQLYGAFVLDLSALDLLFSCGPASLELILRADPTREAVRLAALEAV